MRFCIGYQLPDEDESISSIVQDFKGNIAEIYFALPGAPSGRSPLGLLEGWTPDEARAVQGDELKALSKQGIDLVLLLNAACYGGEAISAEFADWIEKAISRLLSDVNLRAVTTTSPFAARIIRERFGTLKIRASVNMRIGTVKAMAYLADWFDGYYLQREWNRDPATIEKLKSWCDAHGKSLHILANSGCLWNCSFQSFHDNLVAHEAGVAAKENIATGYPAPCWEYLARRENWVAVLQNTWIRPEDIHHYERWFDTAKLATRMHASPRRVVAAYARGRFDGNLLDLTEPGYAPLFGAWMLDNSRFPAGWFETTSKCDRDCTVCSYCGDVLEKVLVNVDQELTEKLKRYGSAW